LPRQIQHQILVRLLSHSPHWGRSNRDIMAAAARPLALPLLLLALAAGGARGQSPDPALKLIKGGATPTAVPNDPAEFLPSRRCPLVVARNNSSAQPLRINPALVAAKNRLGCISPQDAVYGNDGCPLQLCGANQGVVPLPQQLPQPVP
jgi:hypothetical protein